MDDEAGQQQSELSRLAYRLRDPFFRKAFSADPAGALSQEGIRQELIPEEILGALAELSHQELRALSRIRKVLEDNEATRDETMDMV
jgi:hypothetical protein